MLNQRAIKLDARPSLEDVENVFAGGLEMRRRVVSLRNEKLRSDAVVQRLINVTDLKELLLDRAEQGDSRLDFVLRVCRFNGGRDHGDEPALGGHLVSVADHGDVDVRIPSDLLLRDNDLGRQCILRVGNWMI